MAAKVLEWIIIHWYFMFGILGIVFALGKFYGWMKANLVTHSDIKHMVTKNEIYKDDGGLIYMPATELNTKMDDMKKACLNHRENCSSAICKKIDNLKKDLDEIKDVSKGYQDGMQKTMLKISEHMGKTSEFMENHKLSMVRLPWFGPEACKCLIPGASKDIRKGEIVEYGASQKVGFLKILIK